MPHTIALRGPWQVSTKNTAGRVVSEVSINVRKPADWDAWVEAVANPNDWATIHFARRFNWPAGQAESLNLVWQGDLPHKIWLNDVEVPVSAKQAILSVPITEQLAFSNLLQMSFEAGDRVFPTGFQGLLSAVQLSINDV